MCTIAIHNIHYKTEVSDKQWVPHQPEAMAVHVTITQIENSYKSKIKIAVAHWHTKNYNLKLS